MTTGGRHAHYPARANREVTIHRVDLSNVPWPTSRPAQRGVFYAHPPTTDSGWRSAPRDSRAGCRDLHAPERESERAGSVNTNCPRDSMHPAADTAGMEKPPTRPSREHQQPARAQWGMRGGLRRGAAPSTERSAASVPAWRFRTVCTAGRTSPSRNSTGGQAVHAGENRSAASAAASFWASNANSSTACVTRNALDFPVSSEHAHRRDQRRLDTLGSVKAGDSICTRKRGQGRRAHRRADRRDL